MACIFDVNVPQPQTQSRVTLGHGTAKRHQSSGESETKLPQLCCALPPCNSIVELQATEAIHDSCRLSSRPGTVHSVS